LEALHCPFCGTQHGPHDEARHQQWRDALGIDYPLKTNFDSDPRSSDYAGRALEWIFGQSMPPLMLSFECVRGFADCMVALWTKVRLGR